MVAQEKSRCCGSLGQFCYSIVRCLEHLPIIGHGIAAIHACCGERTRAERAACKATIGIILGIFNIIAEAIDEMSRSRSPRTHFLQLASRTQWMKDVHHKKLEDLCIPATHQSATYSIYKKTTAVPLVGGWAICQSLDLESQLNGGVRMFDLRVTEDDQKKIWTHHNLIWCIPLQTVLETVREFVDRYPSEVVCLHFNNDGQPINWSRVDEDIMQYLGEEKIISGVNQDLTLGQMTARNENVIIFNVPYAHYSWSAPDNRWPNTARPSELFLDLETYIDNYNEYKPSGLFWYKAECTPDCPLITRDLGGLMGMWVAGKTDEKVEFIEGLAGVVNHGVDLILENESSIPFNFLSIDFAHDGVIEKIINSNFTKPSGMSVQQTDSMMMNDPMYNTAITKSSVAPDMDSSMSSEMTSLINNSRQGSAASRPASSFRTSSSGVPSGTLPPPVRFSTEDETVVTMQQERTVTRTDADGQESTTLIRESAVSTTSSVV